MPIPIGMGALGSALEISPDVVQMNISVDFQQIVIFIYNDRFISALKTRKHF